MKRLTTFLLICAVLPLGITYGACASKPYTLHYEVKMQSEAFGDMGTRKLWIKGSDMRWEADSADLPLKIIKNDRGVFLIHPWNKIAAEYPEGSPRGNPTALLPGPTGSPKVFLEKVKAAKRGQETVEKQLCDVYTYTEPTTKRDCKIWVSAKTKKPVKLRMAGEPGKVDTVTAVYTKYVEGAKVDDSLFKLPEGYKIRPMPTDKKASHSKTKQPNSGKSG